MAISCSFSTMPSILTVQGRSLSACACLANDLFGLKTVAEGIETTHEAHKLQALGCDVGQGYLYSKPMSKAQLIGLMRKRFVDAPAAAAVPSEPQAAWVPNFSKS